MILDSEAGRFEDVLALNRQHVGWTLRSHIRSEPLFRLHLLENLFPKAKEGDMLSRVVFSNKCVKLWINAYVVLIQLVFKLRSCNLAKLVFFYR